MHTLDDRAATNSVQQQLRHPAEKVVPDDDRDRPQNAEGYKCRRFGQFEPACRQREPDQHESNENRSMQECNQLVVEFTRRAADNLHDDARNDKVGQLAEDNENERYCSGLQIDVRAQELDPRLDLY